MSRIAPILSAAILLTASAALADSRSIPTIIDDFDHGLAAWSAHPSEGVELRISSDEGRHGKAMRLDFDFRGHAGYAIARRQVDLDLPPNYAISFWMRADAPVNNLELKLVDQSSDNVWWMNRRDFEYPRTWSEIVTRRRQISFAWGPAGGGEIRHVASMEIVVTAGSGGKGTVWIDDLTLAPMPPPDKTAATFRAVAGRRSESRVVDFGHVREIGGLAIAWDAKRFARDFAIELSRDGREYERVREVMNNPGGEELIWLPDRDARFLRIVPQRTSDGGWAMRRLEVETGEWAPTVNDFFAHVAERARRGDYPRYLVHEQPYWTILGADRAEEEALAGEDGNVEPFKRGFSIEPFVRVGGRVISWADATIGHSLDRGDLPVTTVTWSEARSATSLSRRADESASLSARKDRATSLSRRHGQSTSLSRRERVARAEGERRVRGVRLAMTSFVSNDDTLYVRYRVTGATHAVLYLAIRPFQVNPSTQFLNTPGGASPIREIAFDGSAVVVNGSERVVPLTAPQRVGASTCDEGSIVDAFRSGAPGRVILSRRSREAAKRGEGPGAVKRVSNPLAGPRRAQLRCAARRGILSARRTAGAAYASSSLRASGASPAENDTRSRILDPFGYASAALEYPLTLAPDHAKDVVIAVPLRANAPIAQFADALEATKRSWREKLDRVTIDIPAAPEIANTLRSNIAYILINRDGAALQPGSRSYERAWIRDGSLIASVLLRLGLAQEAKDFAEWFAPYQFADGKVPCCVDKRGADPVPENDSHGELIGLVAEIWRYTHDEAFVRRMWPHVNAAARYIAKLRSENHGEFEGLLTESISHEGYSAKPMHSYWDDFFGVRGVEDAAELAGVLDLKDRQRELQEEAASFRRDVSASIERSMAAHHIDYVPGSAELGDFDATSTAIAISPLDLASLLPPVALRATFDRYLADFRARAIDWSDRQASTPSKWDVYTPYELRNVGAFVRLGRRAEAHELLDFFMRDRRPAAWNEWAEVVPRNPRSPHFLGDMPHSWVGSDYMRSVLDFFAFDREDGAVVIAAGVPRRWVEGSSIHAGPLATYSGTIDIRMRGDAHSVTVELGGDAHPRSGFVLRSPYEAPIREVRVNGVVVGHRDDEVMIAKLPAQVEFSY